METELKSNVYLSFPCNPTKLTKMIMGHLPSLESELGRRMLPWMEQLEAIVGLPSYSGVLVPSVMQPPPRSAID